MNKLSWYAIKNVTINRVLSSLDYSTTLLFCAKENPLFLCMYNYMYIILYTHVQVVVKSQFFLCMCIYIYINVYTCMHMYIQVVAKVKKDTNVHTYMHCIQNITALHKHVLLVFRKTNSHCLHNCKYM